MSRIFIRNENINVFEKHWLRKTYVAGAINVHPWSLSSFYYFTMRIAQIVVFEVGFSKFKLPVIFDKFKKRKRSTNAKKQNNTKVYTHISSNPFSMENISET